MVEATGGQAHRAATASRARLDLPVTPASLAATLQHVVRRARRPSRDHQYDVRFSGERVEGRIGPQIGAMLRPIATPLRHRRLRRRHGRPALARLSASGFQPVAGAGAAGRELQTTARPARPGDAVGVSLIDGDLSLGATGTVTNVDGERVYAFGHPFYNLGPTTSR